MDTATDDTTLPKTRKRKVQPFPLDSDIDAPEALNDGDDVESDASFSEKKKKAPKKARTGASTSSAASKAGSSKPAGSTTKSKAGAKSVPAKALIGHCSLSKKDFGDKIKGCLSLEKYSIQRMSFVMEMDVVWFRNFFQGNAHIAPSTYDADSEVVVATLSRAQAGDVFGVSKIKNGNRYSTYHLSAMCVVLYPKAKKATAWVSV